MVESFPSAGPPNSLKVRVNKHGVADNWSVVILCLDLPLTAPPDRDAGSRVGGSRSRDGASDLRESGGPARRRRGTHVSGDHLAFTGARRLPSPCLPFGPLSTSHRPSLRGLGLPTLGPASARVPTCTTLPWDLNTTRPGLVTA